ncbi:MAG: hypothetical protein COW04_02505 [Deltaproteobacteria bacterium CG12_big_fil_rev_8_21_14_0_65_43_10]|nr:MAG: hypothetical protein AUK23_04505 [Deltaproteobacteria bacterium CG2_30_43_15]PIQ46378.1 MAG: hypothetical protein COW04_02505 [Deltaproteobacteria bacterium CG12_big_fil_rev_8_21_14_0_65_43_10]PIU86542.1 MAG: hypothetical protein COS67_01925 [Deltaproteobacteria bacterium CG06_land_8_20_14_3_00_44_19]PIX24319.1 MAG: hypothetical protein COZ68_06795 [Deltaproteobacteria bacterium CG_4_8_14_3_um_filter_43_13]PIZ20143.1 MAG: hypothetical protein COY50_06290 [Deltaproteobacteria bacterium C
MDNPVIFLFKHSGKESYIQIQGELSPKTVYDIYSFLSDSLSPHCQHLTIDLKEIDQYTTFGTFLLSSVVRELKKTIQSIRILGISSGQEGNFKNLGMLNLPEYNPSCGFEGTTSLMEG